MKEKKPQNRSRGKRRVLGQGGISNFFFMKILFFPILILVTFVKFELRTFYMTSPPGWGPPGAQQWPIVLKQWKF